MTQRADTLLAFLRAHVAAIRFARAHRGATIATIEKWLRFTPGDAGRAYDEAARGLDERGALTPQGLAAFWEIAVAAGEVTAAWPESRFLDRRFIDAYPGWAPR